MERYKADVVIVRDPRPKAGYSIFGRPILIIDFMKIKPRLTIKPRENEKLLILHKNRSLWRQILN